MGDVLATAVASDGLLQLGLGDVEVLDKRLAVGNGVEVVLVNLQVDGKVERGAFSFLYSCQNIIGRKQVMGLVLQESPSGHALNVPACSGLLPCKENGGSQC